MARLSDVLSIDRLPAVPTVLARAVPLLLDPACEWEALERVVRQDEALTGAILRQANSARYGAPGRHFDLRGAMTRLGREALRWTVLQQQVSTVAGTENAAYGLHRGEMWRSSLAGAIAADALARRHAPEAAPLAFLCGLLRDIGKLALNATYGADYAAAVHAHSKDGCSFTDAERATLGFDHAVVGGALARRWNLPERIAAAIEAHHQPPPPGHGHDPLFDAVHAGDAICRWAGFGIGVDGMEYALAPHVRQAFGLDRKTAENLIQLVWEGIRDAETPPEQAASKGAAA